VIGIDSEQSQFQPVSIDQLIAVAQDPLEEQQGPIETQAFDGQEFWSLIHPEVQAEARPRFDLAHYADAVEAALKVVAQKAQG